jgi:hypothetical protein
MWMLWSTSRAILGANIRQAQPLGALNIDVESLSIFHVLYERNYGHPI